MMLVGLHKPINLLTTVLACGNEGSEQGPIRDTDRGVVLPSRLVAETDGGNGRAEGTGHS